MGLFSLSVITCAHAMMAMALKVLGMSHSFSSGTGAEVVYRGGILRGGGPHGGGTRTGASGARRWAGVGARNTWLGREVRWVPVMGNLSTVLSAVSGLWMSWLLFPGEWGRAFSAVMACLLLLLLQPDGRLLRRLGAGNRWAVPVGCVAVCLVSSALHYILVKDFPIAFTGHPESLAHLYGMYGKYNAHLHGQAALAHRGVNLWASESPWRPLWNILLIGISVPSHVRLVLFLWGGHGSTQRAKQVVLALAANVLTLVAGDLVSINLMGALGLGGGLVQLSLASQRSRRGMRLL
ncbi:unnamed protein product [Discosporangium mesarthrocarpum]